VHVTTKLGKFAMIKQFSVVQELPKPRSGKIRRRLLPTLPTVAC